MAEKFSIDGNIIGTTADNVEYGKDGWSEATNLKAAIDDLHLRLTDIELNGGGGSSDDDIIQVSGTWVSFGDSITALNDGRGISSQWVTKGYQDRVMEKIQFSNFHNYAYSGYRAYQYSTEIGWMNDDEVVPDYVTWLFGTNDYYQYSTKGTLDDYIAGTNATYASRTRNFVDAIKAINPNVKIILCTFPKRGGGSSAADIPHWWVQHRSTYQAEWADVILQIADYDSRIDGVCDFFNLPMSNDSTLYNASDPSKGLLYDGTHPSDLGMQRMADMLIETFKKVLSDE